MNETAHAPGPWQIDEVRTSCGRAFRIGTGEMLAAGKGCCIIYDDYPGIPNNQRAANAHLIGASPDMYEALQVLLEAKAESALGGPRYRDLKERGWRMAAAALAKAKASTGDGR